MKTIETINLFQSFDELKDLIKENHDPFCAPIICFPTPELKKWFKANWLKTEDDVLLNVKTLTFNSFVMQEIYHDSSHLITQEIMEDLLINYLYDNVDLLPDFIKNYIYVNSFIDADKLYDISAELANIFIKYEDDQFQPTGYQKELFDNVLAFGKSKGYVTRSYFINSYKMFRKNKQEQKLYIFGISNFSKLEEKALEILDNAYDTTLFLLKEENLSTIDIKVTNAPSILREVEYVHSTICQLIKDEDAIYSDIVVYAPDITKYISSIIRVFNQDGINFPNIKYVIDAYKKDDNPIYDVLSVLFDIANKGYYTRFDFYRLVTNPVIRSTFDITDDDINGFITIITQMNIYRTTLGDDAFLYSKRRLLLSKLVPNEYEYGLKIDDENYISFESLEVDDSVIVKYLNIIDNIYEFYDSNFNDSDIYYFDELIYSLNKWFIKDDETDINPFYKKVLKRLIRFTQLVNKKIPLKVTYNIILEAAKSATISKGNILIDGITFTNISSSTIPSKYSFIMGLSSNEFLKPTIFSELDERINPKANEEQELSNFNLIKQNSKKLYLSYINRNLKTDEIYYPSKVITDLSLEEDSITIDETRKWKDLFTKKEYKSKDYYLGLVYGQKLNSLEKPNLKDESYNRVLKVKDFKSFIEEPLIYKADKLFKQYEDTSLDMEDEFLPFDLDNITKYVCIKELSKNNLENNTLNLKEKWSLENVLPKGELGDILYSRLQKNVKEIVDFIREDCENASFEIIKYDDLAYQYKDVKWILSLGNDVCRYVNGTNRWYKEIKELKDRVYDKDYINLYIYALADISTLDENVQYNVYLYRSPVESAREFTLTKKEALDILNNLHLFMNNYHDLNCIPLSCYSGEYRNYSALTSAIERESWQYFDNAKMFNMDTDLGYNHSNYADVIKEYVNLLLPYLKFIKLEEKKDDNI